MKPCLRLGILLLVASAGSVFADPVELNGITSLFGENTAFLMLHPQSQTEPVSFALTAGESRFGIKLLAVDPRGHRATIEQAGETLYLRLCSAPDVASATLQEGNPGWTRGRRLTQQEKSDLAHFLNQDPQVQGIKSGTAKANPVPAAPYPGSTKSDSAPSASQTANNSPTASSATSGSSSTGSSTASSTANSTANSTASSTANSTGSSTGSSTGGLGNQISDNAATDSGASAASSTSGSVTGTSITSSTSVASTSADATASAEADDTTQYWYVTSVGIEQNRLATASQVLSGALNPLPRTPLTPAQTPASLVGSETFFPNHIPGFVYTGSVDGWAD